MRIPTIVIVALLLFAALTPWFHFSVLETSRHSVEGLYAGAASKFSPEKVELSLPIGSRLSLGADGTRAVFVRELNGSRSVFLWEEGGMERRLNSEGSAVMGEPAFAADGLSVAFFASSGTPNASLYLWEEGFPLRRLIENAFLGDWSLAISAKGERLFLYPQNAAAVFSGKVSPELNWKSPQALVLSFQARAESSAHVNEGLKDAERAFSIRPVNFESPLESASFSNPSEILSWNAERKQTLERTRVAFHHVGTDIDGDQSDDLLLFKQEAELSVWNAMSLGGRDGPTDKKTAADAKYVSWRVGEGMGLPVPGDYNGDGVLDLATFTPKYASAEVRSHGNWQISISQAPSALANGSLRPNAQYFTLSWGLGNMIPVAADYDGDGSTDIATWDPDTGNWHILYSRGGFDVTKALHREKNFGARLALGKKGDMPIPADFDGNGRVDPAVSGISASGKREWKIYFMGGSRKDKVKEFDFGFPEDIPFAADFNCDGDAEAAVYRPSEKTWYVRSREDKIDRLPWGIDAAYPILGDFDGDGCTDLGFYSPQTIHKWYLMSSRFKEGVFQYFPAGRTAITAFVWGGIPGALPPQVWLRQFAEHQD